MLLNIMIFIFAGTNLAGSEPGFHLDRLRGFTFSNFKCSKHGLRKERFEVTRTQGCFRIFVEQSNIEVLEVLDRCQETCYAVGPVEPFARLCKSITRDCKRYNEKQPCEFMCVLGLIGCKLLQGVNEKSKCKFV